MTDECLANVVAVDSAAVIGYADICNSAAFYFKRDLIRSCVDRIFHYLLNNGCRTLYNLACGDKLGNMLW